MKDAKNEGALKGVRQQQTSIGITAVDAVLIYLFIIIGFFFFFFCGGGGLFNIPPPTHHVLTEQKQNTTRAGAGPARIQATRHVHGHTPERTRNTAAQKQKKSESHLERRRLLPHYLFIRVVQKSQAPSRTRNA
uniref:Uncharacterized protein n=1 Tax=Trypanosoma vivax (strain Y486) TaxID=1055687 RepID=G0U5Y6_TRYVY|nr:hypothetical protein, unlikely [Trypanosoma vivax Y486]